MIRTYLDIGPYIATWRGPEREKSLAEGLFRDPTRVLVGSSIVRLELARHRNNTPAEVAHFAALFDAVHVWIPLDEDLAFRARELRTQYDLGSLDALHVAAAEAGVVDQFVTTEKPGKPLYRVGHIGPVYLGDL